MREILERYIPERAVPPVFEMIKANNVHLKIVNERKTRHGDYRRMPNGAQQITVNANLNKYRFLITLVHEIAHLLAFEKFGRQIKPHGQEWKFTFRELMLPFIRPEVFPSGLLPVIAQHFRNPKASSDTDAEGNALGGQTYVQRKDGVLLPEYRLPTEVEWEYAASALVGIRDYNVYRGRKKYPWDGQYTRSGDVKKQGDQLANFKQGAGDYGGIAGWSDDGADITAEVKSYEPNDFGLYDMAGNVAEWVADVYRPIVDDEFNDFNYYRGNVYTKNAINEDGSVKVVGVDEIEFDTLATGRLVARSYPGDIAQIPVTEEDTYMRTNYTDSDQRNFRDGDKSSSRYYQAFQEADDDSQRMYNSPTYNVAGTPDSTGVAKRGYDSADRNTLISDEVRVYKGGSWRDRAYWLDPAQRRYFPQDMATDYIGFRNAMSRVGSKSLDENKKARN